MPLKCVPLNPDWTSPGAKEDLQGIYARPKKDNWGQLILGADGQPQYDAVALPMRRHIDWAKKGYAYVTLADEDSLRKAAPWLRQEGLNPNDYANQDRKTRSPFNAVLWLEGAEQAKTAKADAITAMVEKFGPDAVEAIQKATDPGFVLPAHLRPKESKGKGKSEPVSA